MKFTAGEIAAMLQGIVEGNPGAEVCSFSKIEEGQPGSISFLANPKYTHYIYDTQASVVLVNEDFVAEKPVSTTLIRVRNSYEALARLLQFYEEQTGPAKGIHPQAYIHPEAQVGENVYIGPFACIEKGVSIGNNTNIYPHVFVDRNSRVGENCNIYSGVKIYHEVQIGNNCNIHSGCIIGADGFGFVPQSGSEFIKVKQVGNVIIEDNVEIGANTCVDRATLGSTIIRKGVKLDNLIQIAHNVEIGDTTVIAALTGISGTTKIGKNCMIAGQVGMVGHIKVGDGVKIGAQSGLIHGFDDNATIVGAPAMDSKEYMKCVIGFKKLPDIMKKLNEIEKRLNSME
ncbi:MAG TPA: UDP-3-O-(3-hydroxymyristoyl)glucosamine N-acyltransferase [Bacteroidales bacterium]|nr:UDP-3-O-(3-hydroxymyristoyl)glucosamine N-acyltransferase [Bacteroidales bacterium]HQL69295.1 UDP-3-O-(3-hydroxymyristoyl)glucosamine N-acyltransferase [Bacteroidales bacterium]